MKECLSCNVFYQESAMVCERCKKTLVEIDFKQALEHTRKKFLKRFSGSKDVRIFDPHTQYIVGSYFKNHSLFLYFDLNRNQMKYGLEVKRFFIQPVNAIAFFNLPWVIFNFLYSNYFHFLYKGFCNQCHCKHRLGQHSKDECDYNIAYFHILRDVLNGDIVHTKRIYQQCAESADGEAGTRRAYLDLSRRHKKTEVFFDLLSIGFSVFLWIFLAVYVSFPMFKVLLQKIHLYDMYEWRIF
ncbi:MAG: hypothetical protein PHY73_05270 [Candidatus Omnitrophica bacterium]|nr:hypothetical protein [Candidatus Omnitrophota bacterium]